MPRRVNLIGVDGKSPLALAIARMRSLSADDRIAGARILAGLVKRGEVSGPVAEKRLEEIERDPVPAVVLAVGCAFLSIDSLAHVRRMRDKLRASLEKPADAAMMSAATRAFLSAADDELRASLVEAAEAAAKDGANRVEPAVWILAEVAAHGDVSVIRTLLGVLADPEVRHRAAAAWALGRSGRIEALAACKQLVLSGNAPLVARVIRGVAEADTGELASKLLDAVRYEAPERVLEQLRISRRQIARRAPAGAT